MRQVRWRLQTSLPERNNWQDRGDLVYDGWFHSTGNDEPSANVTATYHRAVEMFNWLDVRLLQEIKSFQTTVLSAHQRKTDDEQAEGLEEPTSP